MIYDFRKGVAAIYFSTLFKVDYNLDLEEFQLSPNELEFDDLGFFVSKSKKGNNRLGIFLHSYYDKKFNSTPALHIFKCPTTLNLEYRMGATNTAKNTYYSKDDKIDKTTTLKICKDCLKAIKKNYKIKLGENTFNNFILSLEENSRTRQTITDRRGYILNWKQVSYCYRDSKKFTCEKCGFKAQNDKEKRYLHTHHINRDKLDNTRSNFQCLCIKCHSEVDDYHRTKFEVERLHELVEFNNHVESKKETIK